MPPQSDWSPKTEVVEDWQPQTERTPVAAHTRSPRKSLARGVVEHLPDIGGAVGDILTSPALAAGPLGVPIRAGAAALGGAGGEAARQLIGQAGSVFDPGGGWDAPTTSGQAAGMIGLQGAKQGAYSAAGGLAAKGLGMVAKPTMQWALKATPEVAQVAIREGITSTRAGLDKVMSKLGQAGVATRKIVNDYTRKGIQFHPSMDVAPHVEQEVLTQISGQPIAQDDMRKLAKMTQKFLADHPGTMTPTQLHISGQAADDMAAPIWKKIAQKEPIPATMLLKARWAKAYGDRVRTLLNGLDATTDPVTGKLISPIQQANARTSQLIDVKEAVAPLVKGGQSIGARLAGRSVPTVIGGGAGMLLPAEDAQARTQHGLGGAIGGTLLTSPAFLSWLALRMGGQTATQGLQQLPRALGSVAGF